MEENQFKNKISQLELENFTCFTKATFEFSSGINIFIGENGTGKTHILKLLHGVCENNNEGRYTDRYDASYLKYGFDSIFNAYFKSAPIELMRHKDKPIKASISFGEKILTKTNPSEHTDGWLNSYDFDPKRDDDDYLFMLLGDTGYKTSNNNLTSRFIPTNEILSIYNGFIAAWENRENGFDKTYYDLAKALNALPLKKRNPLMDELEAALSISVVRQGEEFYIKFRKEDDGLKSAMVATGINKLAQLIYLIMNGALTQKTVLFWDEPETNLNPRYTKLVAQFLQTLAKAGMQIFMATHDYLLVHQLSLAAEYRAQTHAPPMRFFSLYKGKDGTSVEVADNLTSIENNTILDEFAAFYDLENSLFVTSRPA